MAINLAGLRNYHMKQAAANKLASQLEDEKEAESGFRDFLSIAAPLAATMLLPMGGGMLMGAMGGMAGGTSVLGTLLGGAGAAGAGGTGLLGALAGPGGSLSTITGGLLTGAAKGAGSYYLGEGMEAIGRKQGYGADVNKIDLSEYGRRGKKAQKKGREDIELSIDAMDKGQRDIALMAGSLQAVKSMGGLAKMKAMSRGFGEGLFKGESVASDSTIAGELADTLDEGYNPYVEVVGDTTPLPPSELPRKLPWEVMQGATTIDPLLNNPAWMYDMPADMYDQFLEYKKGFPNKSDDEILAMLMGTY